MVRWSWRRVNVSPEDILSAAQTLETGSRTQEIDLVSRWTSSAVYLKWARECLMHNDSAFGADAALCYAKRAACREIDAFMTCNHLSHFLGCPYPAKIQMLSDVGLRIPNVIHQLIIDPRNESEHSYQACTSRDAKIAVEIAELFLKATADERTHHAIISIGWSIGIVQQRCSIPGKEYERIEFSLTAQHAPMLLIDVCADDHEVMILHPNDAEVSRCSLRDFKREQVVSLAQLLRRQYSFQNGPAEMRCDQFNKLKVDLGLS